MSERLLQAAAQDWDESARVLTTVLSTRGATPRKAGAMMLVSADDIAGSVGGGEAEARVIRAARQCLAGETAPRSQIKIDLGGGPDAAGVCGGVMTMGLRLLSTESDRAWLAARAADLQAGRVASLELGELGGSDEASESLRVAPNPRLLIVGAGHCGLALCDLARWLDFDIWLFDERDSPAGAAVLTDVICLAGDVAQLASALQTEREVWVVLLTRNFECDVAALNVLASGAPRWIGMMGSRKRIGHVLSRLQDNVELQVVDAQQGEFRLNGCVLRAPVGLPIGAETPHEIAVSILAQITALQRTSS